MLGFAVEYAKSAGEIHFGPRKLHAWGRRRNKSIENNRMNGKCKLHYSKRNIRGDSRKNELVGVNKASQDTFRELRSRAESWHPRLIMLAAHFGTTVCAPVDQANSRQKNDTFSKQLFNPVGRCEKVPRRCFNVNQSWGNNSFT